MDQTRVTITNPAKLFWPEERYTKGDLVEYYRSISPWLLPWLAERPVVLTRFPDGINGKSFYQKDAPAFTPDWLRTERMWSGRPRARIDYFVADDVPALLYLANLASIPLHVWLSRVGTLELAGLGCVHRSRSQGRALRRRRAGSPGRSMSCCCDDIGLPPYARPAAPPASTCLISLARQLTPSPEQGLRAAMLSRVVVARIPEIATVVRAVLRGDGKVYSTTCQNTSGR